MADVETIRMENDPSGAQSSTGRRSNASLAQDDGAKLQQKNPEPLQERETADNPQSNAQTPRRSNTPLTQDDGAKADRKNPEPLQEPTMAGLPEGISEKHSESSQDEKQQVPDTSNPKKAPRVGQKNRIFPPRQADPFNSRGGDPGLDYEKKYPADDIGLEMGSSARVWRVYMDEADMFDTEMVQKFMDTVDLLLVFAGLFSAVVTTFVVQTSQSLQPDYAQITASLMTEMVLLQRAMAQGIPDTVVNISKSALDVSSTMSERMDTWINGLWFTSLSFALSVALFAILVKQWLHSYISAYSGTPRDRVVARQIRYDNLGKWGVPIIIGLLPVLLHIALLLFFVGLVLFIHQLQLALIYATLPFAGVGYAAYFVSVALSIFFRDCPYQTPLSTYCRELIACCRGFYVRHIQKSSESPSEDKPSIERLDGLLTDAMVWLHKFGSNPTCRTIVTKALAASADFVVEPSHSSDQKQHLHNDGFTAAVSALARLPWDNWSGPAAFPGTEELNLRVVLLRGDVPEIMHPWHLSSLEPIINYHGQVEPVILAEWTLMYLGELTTYVDFEYNYPLSDLCHDLDRTILGEDALPPALWMRIITSLHTLVSSRTRHSSVRAMRDTLLQLLVLGCSNPPSTTAAFDWYDTGTLTFAEMCSSNGCFNNQLLQTVLSGHNDGRKYPSEPLDPILTTLECIRLWAKNVGQEGQTTKIRESDFMLMMVDFFLVEVINEVNRGTSVWENYTPHIWETMNHLVKHPMHLGHTGRAYIKFMWTSLLLYDIPTNVNMSAEIEYIFEAIQTLSSPNKPQPQYPSDNEGNHFPERYILVRSNSPTEFDPIKADSWVRLLRLIIDKVGFNIVIAVLESHQFPILLSPAAREIGEEMGLLILTLLARSYIAGQLTAPPETLAALGSRDNLTWLLTIAFFVDIFRLTHDQTVQDVLAGLHAAVPSSNPSWRPAIIAVIAAMNRKAEADGWLPLSWRYSALQQFAAEKLGIIFDSNDDFAPQGFTVPEDLETDSLERYAIWSQAPHEYQAYPQIGMDMQKNSTAQKAGRLGSFLRKVQKATKFVRSSQSREEEKQAEVQVGDEAV